MPTPPGRAVLPALVAVTALLAGCGGPPSTKDFADQAVSFIEGDMARNTQLNGLTLTDAQCAEPETTNAGTEYTCTAMGSDGQQRTLTAKITGRNKLQITDIQPPPPAGGGSSTPTTAAGAAPTTAAPTTGP